MGRALKNIASGLGIVFGSAKKFCAERGIWAGLLWLSAGIGILFLFLMMLVTTVDVLARYVLNYPIRGVFEIDSNIFWPAVFALSLGLVQMQKRHVLTQDLVKHFRPAVRRILEIFCLTMFGGLVALLTWKAWVATYMDWTEHNLIEGVVTIPMYWTRFLIFFSFALLLVQVCVDLVEAIRRKP